MLFTVYCTDKPDSVQLRMDTRTAHLEHLASIGDRLKAGGPTTQDDGETPSGSILVIEADDLAAARSFADADPYNQAGLFQSVEVKPFKWLLGTNK
jgi:uncharacterized protein